MTDSENEFYKMMDKLSKDIATSRSARVISESFHYYIERWLNKILEKYRKIKPEIEEGCVGFKNKNVFLMNKARLLFDNNILNDNLFNDIDIQNEIRNLYKHSERIDEETMEPSKDSIVKLIHKLKFDRYNDNMDYRKRIGDNGITILENLNEVLKI